MGDVAVENPATTLPPHRKMAPVDSMPEIDSFEGVGANGEDEYSTLKRLQRHLEYVLSVLKVELVMTTSRYIKLQEEYIKDEQRYRADFTIEACVLTCI